VTRPVILGALRACVNDLGQLLCPEVTPLNGYRDRLGEKFQSSGEIRVLQYVPPWAYNLFWVPAEAGQRRSLGPRSIPFESLLRMIMVLCGTD
jgi:hypothetical protein